MALGKRISRSAGVRPFKGLGVSGRRVAATAVLALAALCASARADGELRYRPKEKQHFAYEVDITASLPSANERYTGTIEYTVRSVGDVLKLEYRGGGMRKSVEAKSSDDFPPARGMGFPPSRFGREPNLGGLNYATNQLAITPRGEIRTMTGETQMPFLLGNLSILVFEPLPEDARDSWTVKGNPTVSENNSNGRFGPPFLRFRADEKTTIADESTTFTLESTKGDLVVFRKTYELKVPDENETTTIDAKGRWTFNTKDGLPESLDVEHRISVKSENMTLTIPVTVKYQRLSEQKIAEIEKKRQEQQAKAIEEGKRRQAEMNAPITETTRPALIAKLRAGNEWHELMEPLNSISSKPAGNDEELTKVIRPMLAHSDATVRRFASEALEKVSPDFKRVKGVYDEYTRGGWTKLLGTAVTDQTPLAPNMFVACHERSGSRFRQDLWSPRRVSRLLPDGRVEVTDEHGHRSETYARSELCLAPAELNAYMAAVTGVAPATAPAAGYTPPAYAQPNVPQPGYTQPAAPTGGGPGDYRTWTDNTGTFAIVAQFVSADAEKVQLRRKADGKIVNVPLARLCPADRQAVQQMQQAAPLSSNPFD